MFSWIEVRCIDLCRSWQSWELTLPACESDSFYTLFQLNHRTLAGCLTFSFLGKKELLLLIHCHLMRLKKYKSVQVRRLKEELMKGSLVLEVAEATESMTWCIIHMRKVPMGIVSCTGDLWMIYWLLAVRRHLLYLNRIETHCIKRQHLK